MPNGDTAIAHLSEAPDVREGRRTRLRLLGLAGAIGLVAAGLRCWRISWGLGGGPKHLGFPDEVFMWAPYAASFIPLSWTSFDQTNLNYPTLYGYVVGLAAAGLHALGLLATPPHDVFRTTPGVLLVARGVSAVLGLVTVGLVGLIGSRMYSRRVGFVAAALMAVVPFEVVYAHLAAPDVPLATCAALTILLVYAAVVGSPAWWMAAAGFAAGATTAVKYTGLAMIVPVAWAVAERAVRRRSLRHGVVLAALAAVGFTAAVLLGCPPCVLRADRLLDALGNHLRVSTQLFPSLHNNSLVPTLGWYGRPYLYQLVASLPFVLGWPLYALSLLGVGIALWRHELADRLTLAALVPYFLVMAGSMLVYPRYLLPLLPGLVILAARASEVLPARRMRAALLAAVWTYSLALGASQVARFSLDQQREVAQWIARVAQDQKPARRVRVGVPQLILDYYRLTGPLAAAGLAQVELADGHWFDDPPEFFVLPEWYEIAIERDMPESPAARDLERLRSGAAGYRRGARWRSSFLQRDLYTALDPAFASSLWHGQIGFTVYVRAAAAPGSDPPPPGTLRSK